jgi:hypothetical protein
MLLTNIPTDLIYDIFLLLDSYRTLVAFVTTNRLLYEIFKAYPNVVLRRVLCNEIGMDIQVLPYALATINSPSNLLNTEESMERDKQLQESWIIRLRRLEAKVWNLKTAHATVQGLAKHHSMR